MSKYIYILLNKDSWFNLTIKYIGHFKKEKKNSDKNIICFSIFISNVHYNLSVSLLN